MKSRVFDIGKLFLNGQGKSVLNRHRDNSITVIVLFFGSTFLVLRQIMTPYELTYGRYIEGSFLANR